MCLQETEEFYSSAKLTQKVGEQYKKNVLPLLSGKTEH